MRGIVPEMGKKTAAEVAGANLTRLMANAGYSNVSLESRLSRRVTKSTIGRMRNAENSAQVGSLEEVAKAFGLELWQLLIEGVDPERPPQIGGVGVGEGLSPPERELIDKFRQLEDRNQRFMLADAEKYLAGQEPQKPESKSGNRPKTGTG